MKNNNNDNNLDDYRFEERDDERTFGNELIPDLEKIEKEKIQKAKAYRKAFDYVSTFEKLIKACGQVSYYNSMQYNVRRNVTKPTEVAARYNCSVSYYMKKHNDWVAEAEKQFDILKYQASLIGYDIEDEKKVFLGDLQLSDDRRKCYKYYLNQFTKGKLFSPDELEYKYIQRIMKRKKK